MSNDSDDHEDYQDRPRKQRRTKRNSTVKSGTLESRSLPSDRLRDALDTIEFPPAPVSHEELDAFPSFEERMGSLLLEYTRERDMLQNATAEVGDKGELLRRMTRSEVNSAINSYNTMYGGLSVAEAVNLRKLKVSRERRSASLHEHAVEILGQPGPNLEPLIPPAPSVSPSLQVLDALHDIQTTPFENSFLSRLHGPQLEHDPPFHVDWETKTPWMRLMNDIRAHYALLHPEREQPVETSAPILYMTLQSTHLDQVHDLLERSFWPGINIQDSLDYSPERCTIVATYKRLVVGVAILSSPRETYITYLAVRHGWDNSHIATIMLYQLIRLNPTSDITLHVSITNPAMLLYNRFGFKAEEFVAGFYQDYLDPRSKASKNAFLLRLRHH